MPVFGKMVQMQRYIHLCNVYKLLIPLLLIIKRFMDYIGRTLYRVTHKLGLLAEVLYM